MTTVFLVACSHIAVKSAPAKKETATRSEMALEADKIFWQIFHNGEYEKIPSTLELVKAAYLDNPNDSITSAHVGWLHIWRLAERARSNKVQASITDDLTMARKYFQEAVNMNPSDARFLGFLASLTLAEGNIHKDEKSIREGYYMLLDSIDKWPEFNLFTAGFVMSKQPANCKRVALPSIPALPAAV